jgi:hypothetical protein
MPRYVVERICDVNQDEMPNVGRARRFAILSRACPKRARQEASAKMRRIVIAGAAVAIVAPLVAGLAASGVASAAPRPGLLSAAALQSAAKVPVGARPLVPAADHEAGPVAATATETAAIVLRPRDERALTSFIAGVTTRGSASYHQYLARGQFQARFGPTAAAVANVETLLRADGLAVAGVSSDGLLVTFRGTAATVERAFGIGLERYRLPDGAAGQATIGAPRLSALVSPSVAGIVGLDDLGPNHPQYIIPRGTAKSHGLPSAQHPAIAHVPGAPRPCTLAEQDAETFGGLTDDAIANAYGAFGLYKLGDFAAGQHIAVFEQQPFLATDIETFDTCYFGAAAAAKMSGTNGNLSGSRLRIVPVDGGELQPGPGSENDEATLDVEDVSAMAPGADIDVYEAPNTTFGTIDNYAAIVNSDKDTILTSSWAVCEQLAQVAEPGLQQAENFLFEQAAAQGQTVLGAAGDTGDDECNEYRYAEPPSGQNLLSQLDPASQPYVVSVGGTTIDDATQPPSEHVWNDGAEWGGGGGGISESWPMPSWQVPLADTSDNAADIAHAEAFETAEAAYEAPFGTPTFCDGTLGLPAGTLCREAPDVSAQADEFTGAVTIFGKSLGYGNPNGWETIGGTSSATPIWAAMLALVDASSFCTGETINGVQDSGFASPILYGVAANPAAYKASFNDIKSGNNDDFGLDNGLVFPARAGYDMASGLGSPRLTSPHGRDGLAFYMCHYGAQFSPPAVTGLSPSVGSVAGGETITVTGSGFGSTASPLVRRVSVGGGSAVSFSVVNSTTLKVTLPAADTTVPAGSPNPTENGAGPDQIVVTDTSGLSSLPNAKSLFEYIDKDAGAGRPSVTNVSPSGGLDTDPATVTVFGSGFTAGATVDFGGVPGTDVTVVSPFEITVKPPAFAALTPGTACPTDNGAADQPLNAADDICQVEVTVTEGKQTSKTAKILPPYEGPIEFDNMGAEVLPAGCGCEDLPQTTEYDYAPLPTITATSTGTPATLPATAADLASEFGGAPSNVVTVTGTGLDPLTLSYATLLSSLTENSIFYPVQESGTSMVLLAPALDFTKPTTEPFALPVGADSLAGQSATTVDIWYAGVPEVTSVVNTLNGKRLDGYSGVPDTQECASPPPASGCGTPLSLGGTGFLQAFGPIRFADAVSEGSLGTQYNYTINSDTSISTQSVGQNPAVVIAEACSESGCAFNKNSKGAFLIYPPGNPHLSSISPAKGPAKGGNKVLITGRNLGCAIAVYFGKVAAKKLSNVRALLDCGATNEVDVTVPPGKVGAKVRVTVITVESYFTGSHSNSVGYTYTK